jgi:hypothetical protein
MTQRMAHFAVNCYLMYRLFYRAMNRYVYFIWEYGITCPYAWVCKYAIEYLVFAEGVTQ